MSQENADTFRSFGDKWNRFWFAPSDPYVVSVLRVVVGVFALAYHASFTSDLARWFGTYGLLPR